ncbi:MAG TPA: DEAD/DEAH box helicase, partial [Alphaproteobacteria bacterium]
MGDQIKLLDRGVDVLIATPGRLLDLFERGNILLNDIKILVIDEADRMLDMGFIPDIETIVSKIPPIRQTLLFSATMPPEIKRLASKFLSNPKEISVSAPASTSENVQQGLVWARSRDDKKRMLDAVIRQEDVKNAFVFCNRKKDIGDLTRWLERKGYKAAPMHGDMPQAQRNETLKKFKDGEIVLMICSDVAARGLDVAAVSHVFNYDVPFSPDDYVHRIGRTGRAGLTGRSWTIGVRGDDEKLVEAIERLTKKIIPVVEIEGQSAGQGDEGGERDNGPRRSHDRGGRDRDRGGRGGRDRSGRDRNSDSNRDHSREVPRTPAPERDVRPQPSSPAPAQQQSRLPERPRHEQPPRRREYAEDGSAKAPGFGDEMPDFFKAK